MAETTTQRNRRRRAAGEPLSDTVIDHYIGGIWQLIDVLLELRSIATKSPVLPREMLDAWTTKPARITARAFGARPADIDNTGPSLDACSQRLKWLHAEARVTTQGDGYLKRRRFLLMALVCLYGPRADAFRMVRIEDFLPDHRYPDGTTGPALRIYPGKTWDPDEAHYLPLPDEVARWVEEWVTFTGRRFDQLDEPMFPNRKPKPGRPGKFFTTHGFYNAIAGARQKGGTGSFAMLPRDDDPFIGFHPHAFRHTALQLATQAASNLQRADQTFFPHVSPQEFGKAIVGQELITEVSAIYRDLDRQLLCRAIVDEMWRLLWDDGVLRRGPDTDRVRGAREQRDALRITVDALHITILDLDAKAEQANRRNGGRDPQVRLERQLHRLPPIRPNADEVPTRRWSSRHPAAATSTCATGETATGIRPSRPPASQPRGPNALRHTFATWFLLHSDDRWLLAKLMGTRIDMIEQHYGHLLAPHATRSRDILDAIWDGFGRKGRNRHDPPTAHTPIPLNQAENSEAL